MCLKYILSKNAEVIIESDAAFLNLRKAFFAAY